MKLIDTLASDYAAANRLSDAVDTAEKAYDLALSQGDKQSAQNLKDRLSAFKSALKAQ